MACLLNQPITEGGEREFDKGRGDFPMTRSAILSIEVLLPLRKSLQVKLIPLDPPLVNLVKKIENK